MKTLGQITRKLPVQEGFSLVELAIVLIIVALLSSGLMFGLGNQQKQIQFKEMQNQTDNVLNAIMGFAMTNGRLPCPADPNVSKQTNSAGTEI
ncbi:MAG: type II secretion system protein, partial [Azonexus sp.]|nr:type II secretion system protein [Azonexus sp.]